MNADLETLMNSEETEKLFFYYKHDGAIDFEKKVIAGKILNERSFDKKKLLEEKQMIIDSIKDTIKEYENKKNLTTNNKKKINKGIFFGLGYISFFIIAGLKGFIMQKEPFDWVRISIMTLLVIVFIAYKLVTYKTKLSDLLELDMKDKELLKFRLQLIEKEWSF